MTEKTRYKITLFETQEDAQAIYFFPIAKDIIEARNHAFEKFPSCEIIKIELISNHEKAA